MLRRLDILAETVIEYEDNPEFNAKLDEQIPLSGTILYSKALFDQERKTYEIELSDYNLEYASEDE